MRQVLALAASRGIRRVVLNTGEQMRPARRLYERVGFTERGLRRGYYPMGALQREDAIVMQLNLHSPEAAA